MSEVQSAGNQTPAFDVAATEPVTTTAHDASVDPVRPTESSALSPESRPEIINSTDAPATAATTEAPMESTGATTTGAVDAQPITEGVLGYKAPGLVKSLIFSKKFFWFSDEPVEHKHLSGYISNEKSSDIAHPNAAHATQTGKGLLFFAKRTEDRPHPAGILNLADISDVTKVDFNDFSFKLHGHKHTFQAQSRAERDTWIAAIEAKATEAKGAREGIVSSAGYKSSLEKIGGAGALVATPAAASRSMSRPKKSTDGKLTEEPVAGSAVATNGPATEEIKAAPTTTTEKKSRSQSRKRSSIFGTLMGKKEDHDIKKEEKKEEKAEEKAVKEEVKQEEKAEKRAEKEEKKELKHEGAATTAAPLDAAAIASRVVAEPVVPTEGAKSVGAAEPIAAGTATAGAVEPATETAAAETKPTAAVASRDNVPKPNKRNSIFGSFFGKKDVSSPTKEETAPVVPAKDVEPAAVSATAPQIEDPVSTTVQPTEAAPTTTTDKLDTTSASTPATKQNVSPSATKGGIFSFMKQKEAQHEEKKEIKADEKAETGASSVPAATVETATPAAATTETSAAVTSPMTSPVTSPAATASTPDNGKNTRRQSFFNTLGTKKEKKAGAISDGEATDGESKKSASSKLGGLFRKPSRATSGKPATEVAEPVPALPKETTDAPTPMTKDAPTGTETTQTNGATTAESHAPAAEDTISSSHPQQTPAVQASA